VTYFAARRLVKIPNIGLVNVVAGRQIAPEFVQNDLQPRAVARAVAPLLDRASPERQKMIADLDEVRRMLGEPGAARRVAAIAHELAAEGEGGGSREEGRGRIQSE
jgi:lipid-A-disaccharide synthase